MGIPAEPAYRQRIGYQSMLLGGFSALATVMLVAGNLATRDAIEARQREDLLASLNQVMPVRYYDNDPLAQPLQLPGREGQLKSVYRGTRDLQVSALAWEIQANGYAGEIRLLMGVDREGRILGVRVLAHTETPGLGDKIEVAKDPWITGFNGLAYDDPPAVQWQVKKDGGRFDAFSGATITPRSIVNAVHDGLAYYRQYRTELLVPPAVTTSSDEREPHHE